MKVTVAKKEEMECAYRVYVFGFHVPSCLKMPDGNRHSHMH
jgi:hypothetical protein